MRLKKISAFTQEWFNIVHLSINPKFSAIRSENLAYASQPLFFAYFFIKAKVER